MRYNMYIYIISQNIVYVNIRKYNSRNIRQETVSCLFKKKMNVFNMRFV